MKKVLALSMLAVFFMSTSVSTVFAADLVGNSNSMKYHYTYCKWAKKIAPSHRVSFSSGSEAIAAGYVPCKVCKPPVK